MSIAGYWILGTRGGGCGSREFYHSLCGLEIKDEMQEEGGLAADENRESEFYCKRKGGWLAELGTDKEKRFIGMS